MFIPSMLCMAQTSIMVPQKAISLLDAMEATLAKHPNILIGARQVDIDRGALQQANGQFDTFYSEPAGNKTTPQLPLSTAQEIQSQQAVVTASFDRIFSSTWSADSQKEYRNWDYHWTSDPGSVVLLTTCRI